jgi:MFS family permease
VAGLSATAEHDAEPGPGDPGRPGDRLLRDPEFLRLWTAQTVSAFGTQITILAVPLVAALALQVSPFEFGLLATFESLPLLFLSLPAGVWVDRRRRRPFLVGGDLGRALVLVSIPIAFAAGALTIWQLYAVVIVNACLGIVFDVAYQSYLPTIIRRDRLIEGNARLELTRQASQRLGPGIAGVLLSVVAAPVAILLDAASYVVSAVFVLRIRRAEGEPERESDAAAAEPSMRAEIAAGFAYVVGSPVLRALALTVSIGYLFGTLADSILILFLVTERGMSPALIGLAFSIGSVGVFAGILVAGRITAWLGVGPVILLAALIGSVAWLPIPLAPPEWLFVALTTTIAVLSFEGVLWNVNAMSLRQAITPDRMRGRMNATMRFISWGTIPIGATLGGALGGLIGLHGALWVGALGGLIAFIPVALSPIRAIRTIPEPVSDRSPAPG